LVQLREIHGDLLELGYQVLFISPDRVEKVRTITKGEDYGYTLLSDSKGTAAEAFGVAFRVPDKGVAQLEDYGIDLEDASGEEHHLLPVPSVFIFDGKGKLQFEYVNPDYTVRIDAELLLAAARASLKY